MHDLVVAHPGPEGKGVPGQHGTERDIRSMHAFEKCGQIGSIMKALRAVAKPYIPCGLATNVTEHLHFDTECGEIDASLRRETCCNLLRQAAAPAP